MPGRGRSEVDKSPGEVVDFRVFGRLNGPDRRPRADSASCQQPSSDEEQVAEGQQREELRAVLCEATGSGLEISELALEHPERVFDARPHLGDDPVDVFVQGVQRAALRRLPHDTTDLVGPDRVFLSVQ